MALLFTEKPFKDLRPGDALADLHGSNLHIFAAQCNRPGSPWRATSICECPMDDCASIIQAMLDRAIGAACRPLGHGKRLAQNKVLYVLGLNYFEGIQAVCGYQYDGRKIGFCTLEAGQ